MQLLCDLLQLCPQWCDCVAAMPAMMWLCCSYARNDVIVLQLCQQWCDCVAAMPAMMWLCCSYASNDVIVLQLCPQWCDCVAAMPANTTTRPWSMWHCPAWERFRPSWICSRPTTGMAIILPMVCILQTRTTLEFNTIWELLALKIMFKKS